jgi:hypothetical protein
VENMSLFLSIMLGALFYYFVKIVFLKNKITDKQQFITLVLSVLFVFGVDEYRYYFGSKEVGSLFQRGVNYNVNYYAKTGKEIVIANLLVDNDSNDFTTVYIQKLIFPNGKVINFMDIDNLDVEIGSKSYVEDNTKKEWEITITEDMVKK